MATISSLIGPKFNSFNSLAVSTTAVAVKASGGDVYGWTITNLHTAAIFVKLYNKAAASVNPASDVPVKRLMIPANSMIHSEPTSCQETFNTAISIRVTTGAADTDATAAVTLPQIQIKYY